MNTDRELLELAAKAYGLDGYAWSDEYRCLVKSAGFSSDGDFSAAVFTWNPLISDGDALRLAVKLRMPIWFEDYATVTNQRKCGDLGWRVETGGYDLGGYAATRRAIVIAAAELG